VKINWIIGIWHSICLISRTNTLVSFQPSIILENLSLYQIIKTYLINHLLKIAYFFKYNKIYYKKRDFTVSNIPCISFEGDINHFWLSSKKYDKSYQPFLPTWGLSALIMILVAKDLVLRTL